MTCRTRKSALLSVQTFSFVGVALLALVGLYIFQIGSLTAHAYNATVAEKKIANLRDAAATLQTAIAQNYTAQSIGELASELHFEKVDTVQYIRVIAGSVAQK